MRIFNRGSAPLTIRATQRRRLRRVSPYFLIRENPQNSCHLCPINVLSSQLSDIFL
jgi:hypothetical protein